MIKKRFKVVNCGLLGQYIKDNGNPIDVDEVCDCLNNLHEKNEILRKRLNDKDDLLKKELAINENLIKRIRELEEE